MKKLSISIELGEKIYDLKTNDQGFLSRVISYFPLNPKEKNEIMGTIEKNNEFSVEFKSIFSDEISDKEWSDSKEQIRKKFRDELVDIN